MLMQKSEQWRMTDLNITNLSFMNCCCVLEKKSMQINVSDYFKETSKIFFFSNNTK